MEKVSIYSLGIILEDIKDKIVNNFISHISVISSDNFIFSFSFLKGEKLLVSLNHNSPFISLVNTKENFQTIMGQANEILRKYVSGSYVFDVRQIENDRVVIIELRRTNDYFEKETFYLVLELIPHRSNIILLDKNKKVIFARHYTTLDSSHPIVKGITYDMMKTNLEVQKHDFDLNAYKKECLSFLENAKDNRRKEQFSHLFTSTKNKIHSLEKKIVLLENGLKKAKEDLAYKDMGNLLYTVQNEEEIKQYIKDGYLKNYDFDLTINDNASLYFKKYKKAKSTIEHSLLEIEKAKEEIKDNQRIYNQLQNGDDTDLLEISQSLSLKKGKVDKKKNIKAKISPLFINIKDGKIAFGKTDAQNNLLTFEKANRNDEFFHIANYPASHVVILKQSISDEDRLLAAEIALILANQKDGEVQTTKIQYVKKGDRLGLVHLKEYKTIHINKVREETSELIKTARRF